MDPALLARAESALSKARAAVDVEKRKAALFGSIAGKGTMADDLIKLFPPHKTYTEVFAGGAAVFWSKDPSDVEVLNDFNPEVAHAYKFAQQITDEQIKRLASKNWIGSKELFKKLRDSKPTDPLERFYRLIYLRKAGFARGESACAPDKIGKPVASTLFDRLPMYRDRLKGVRIYSGDFMKPLTTHDGPDTLHFMDPPFPGFKFNIGEGEWDEERFLKSMYALKGKFILTYETRSELNNEFRKRGYRVREWLPKENRGFNPNQEGRQKTTVVTNFERKLNKVFQVPGRLAKKLSPKQREDYERESAVINENRKKPEASKRHDFEAAHWTHPNGHPRCLVCGSEESMSGICNAPAGLEEKISQRFGELRLAESDFDTLRDWDRLLNLARDDVLSRTTKIQIPIEAGDERLAAAVTRLAGAIGIQIEREARVGLESPEADRFVSGELDLLAAARKGLPVGKAIDLIKDGEVIGVAELGKPEQVDLWRFAELTARHGVNDELRRERWPQAKKLFAYPIVKAEPKDPGYVEIELSEAEATALSDARRLAELWHDSIDGFIRRQAMFLDALDDERSKQTLAFVRGLSDLAGDLMGALKEIAGTAAKAERSESAVAIGRELLKVLRVIAPRLPASKSKDVIDRAIKALVELDRLSREEFLREGGHVPEEKRETAPVHPSGEKTGKEIALEDVLPHLKPAVLRRNVVTLVGGLANWGKSRNDVDLLIKGPLGEGLRRVVEFRLGRMVPVDVSQRIQFLDDDEMGGPFTDHVELFDLWLVPRTHQVVEGGGSFEKIEMRDVAKADDPLMDLPKKRGKRPATYQYHFRGRSLHGDLRMQVNDQLVGWTMAPAKAGKIPAVATVQEARRFARRFDRDGSFFEKDWTAPEGLFATPKTRMPRAWLDFDGEKFEPGEIGATANEPGIIVRVTDPDLMVEYGIQKAWAHEYFFTGDSKFSGRLFFRQLTGRGGDASDEESGRRTPAGETFWRSFWTKDLLPSVLNRRSVQRGTMPPDGYSAIPLSLEAVVPAEFRYWEHKGSKARELRDALVDAKILTADNIKIVDGEFRRVVTKTYLDLSAPTIEPTIKRNLVRYGLGWQFWKGQQVVRAGPSRQLWHLVVALDDGKFDAWKLSTDPTSGEDRISGVHRVIDDPALMTYNGDVKPGQRIGGEVLNDSKATPSWIRNVDSGKAELIESSDGVRKLRFRGKLRGTYSLNREEDGSDFWLMELEESATKGRSAGASLFAKRAGRLCFVECPACGAVNLRLNGLRKLDDGSAAESVECNECSALFGIRGEVIDRNTIEDPVDDLDNAPGDDRDYIVIKAVPVRDGVQVWDPERNDPNADRTQLRPLAIYQPMKVPPRETNEFRDIGDLVKRFATPTLLEMGILVEPKYNGFRLSLQKRGNKTLIFTEDEKRDLSAVLPGLVKELRSLPGDFVLDGEGMALDAGGNFIPRRNLAQFRGMDPVDDASLRISIFDALYADGTNLTEKVQTDRRRRVERLLRGKHERFFAAPGKIARTRGELESAVDWARKQPGSEGAMLKGVEATYSLGGENDLWAKYKASRRLRAIVYAKDPVKDSPGVWTYFGAIGPVSAKDAERWTETVEVKGRRWVPIGKTFNSKEKLEIGDAIEVDATEVLLDRSGEKDRIRWFTPTVIGPAGKPMSVGEVESMLRPDEVKKLLQAALSKRIPLIKTEEERFVLGIVLEPNDGANGAPLDPDSQRDIYSAEEIRQAAHKFMEEYRNLGVMHSELANDRIKILESYICPSDVGISGQKVRKGTWLLAVRIVDDTIWQRVKRGELTGFSIGGSAMRSPVRR